MQFISKDERGHHLDAYLQYLRDNVDKFPNGAREFALADWHYNFRHHQCPHDSWLERFAITENASGQRQESTVEIESLFLGAYHDGYFGLTYRKVLSYSLQWAARSVAAGKRAHGDLDCRRDHVDEFRPDAP